MERQYLELIAAGQPENEALASVISKFGNVETFIIEAKSQTSQPSVETKNRITTSEAKSFFQSTKRLALAVAGGILCIAFGIGLMFVLINTFVAWVSILMMLLGIILGVSFFIIGGIAYGRAKQKLDERPISLVARTMARESLHDYTGPFTVLLVTGVGLCIFSLFPLIIQAVQTVSGYEYIGFSAFTWLLGSGIFMIVYGGITYNGFARMAQANIFYTQADAAARDLRKLKQKNPRLHFFLNQIYWPAIVVGYFVGSFYFNGWLFTWLVFPIGGILYSAIRNFALLPKKVDKS